LPRFARNDKGEAGNDKREAGGDKGEERKTLRFA